ncbi:MAG: serine hydrolase domain-containing protein [Rhodoferax sp.]|nr:serine hydrolase domain-containing protein [Rhodoferax sp.]
MPCCRSPHAPQQCRIDIDQPLQKYLPGFAPKTHQPQAAITARQLMTHHSGLPRDRFKGFQNPEPRPFAELKQQMSDDYVAYAPDQRFSYSNFGISLVGRIVETQSTAPFAQYMRQSVLLPMGMSHTSFDTGPAASAQMSQGYRKNEAVPEVPLRDVPAGGLNTSVNDLSRFMAMVFAEGAWAAIGKGRRDRARGQRGWRGTVGLLRLPGQEVETWPTERHCYSYDSYIRLFYEG